MAVDPKPLILAAIPSLLVFLLSCGSASESKLRTRAAFDLNCNKDNIRIVRLDGRTRGVSGCGQQVTYVESCDQVGNTLINKCTWVLNSDSRRARPPQ